MWDEELAIYRDRNRPYPEEVRKSFDKVNITYKNVSIFALILVERMKDKNMTLIHICIITGINNGN